MTPLFQNSFGPTAAKGQDSAIYEIDVILLARAGFIQYAQRQQCACPFFVAMFVIADNERATRARRRCQSFQFVFGRTRPEWACSRTKERSSCAEGFLAPICDNSALRGVYCRSLLRGSLVVGSSSSAEHIVITRVISVVAGIGVSLVMGRYLGYPYWFSRTAGVVIS